MTNQIPCSCGGSNENCVRCYGRGFIESGRLLAPRHKARSKKRKSDPTIRRLNAITSSAPKSMAPRAATRGPMNSCPLCGHQVREDRLQKHMSSKCPLRVGNATTSARGGQQFVKCPACDFKGVTDEFTRHFALVHGTKGRLRRRIQVPIVCLAGGLHPIGVAKAREKKKKKNKAANLVHSTENNSQESLR